MSDEEALAVVRDLKVMSRARPADKQRLVELLQRSGEVVAVTGDGTNDAPALNYAHVGLSLGSGTNVAKNASDITILDDSFRSIVQAVMWGRSLYKNIQRFIFFQLVVNVTALLLVLGGSVIGTELPLTVTQILWVNLIMDTFAAMALASLPPSREVMHQPPRSQADFIITPGMVRGILGLGVLFFVVMFVYLYKIDVRRRHRHPRADHLLHHLRHAAVVEPAERPHAGLLPLRLPLPVPLSRAAAGAADDPRGPVAHRHLRRYDVPHRSPVAPHLAVYHRRHLARALAGRGLPTDSETMEKIGFAATIGMFDGVHRGHQFVIRQLVEQARQHGLLPLVVTFDASPRGEQVLTPLDEKLRLIRQTGVDHIEVLSFTPELKAMTAREFMARELCDRLGVRLLLTGYDNRFGRNRETGFDDYVRYGRELGVEVLGLPAEGAVSSSHIRQLLTEGAVARQPSVWVTLYHQRSCRPMGSTSARGWASPLPISYPTTAVS